MRIDPLELRHSRPELKGKYLGLCNRTACQIPRARYRNLNMQAPDQWYCATCAVLLNSGSKMSPYWKKVERFFPDVLIDLDVFLGSPPFWFQDDRIAKFHTYWMGPPYTHSATLKRNRAAWEAEFLTDWLEGRF